MKLKIICLTGLLIVSVLCSCKKVISQDIIECELISVKEGFKGARKYDFISKDKEIFTIDTNELIPTGRKVYKIKKILSRDCFDGNCLDYLDYEYLNLLQ